ncbi:MAG: GtrA-like protein [Marmoricola sp.]|jgi:putative flippase GtrA|nr:GtrA-like protein [Marmoricola sp.]
MALITRSTVWFVVVGVVNTVIYYAGYLMLHGLEMGYMVAHVAATLIAMVCSYFLNCTLTFQIRPSWKTFLLFPLSNVANFVITTVGIRLAVEQLGVHERLAPLTVALVAIPITFMVTRYLLVDAWQGTYGIGGEREAHEAGNANRLEAPSGSTE